MMKQFRYKSLFIISNLDLCRSGCGLAGGRECDEADPLRDRMSSSEPWTTNTNFIVHSE